MTFKALLATNTGEKISASVVDVAEQDLMPGGVTIRIDYSTVNFKDAMALSGYVDVIKQFPLIAGIDFAGTPVRPHRSAHMGELNGQYLKVAKFHGPRTGISAPTKEPPTLEAIA